MSDKERMRKAERLLDRAHEALRAVEGSEELRAQVDAAWLSVSRVAIALEQGR